MTKISYRKQKRHDCRYSKRGLLYMHTKSRNPKVRCLLLPPHVDSFATVTTRRATQSKTSDLILESDVALPSQFQIPPTKSFPFSEQCAHLESRTISGMPSHPASHPFFDSYTLLRSWQDLRSHAPFGNSFPLSSHSPFPSP